VYAVGEAIASAPVQALEMQAKEGLLPPVRLSARQERAEGSVPTLGQHTTEFLIELGYGAAEVEELQAQGIV
jgi:crotonobetainyl-CoA:carnitine CoA-transferase CaiB-like acyl-CoA transferase